MYILISGDTKTPLKMSAIMLGPDISRDPLTKTKKKKNEKICRCSVTLGRWYESSLLTECGIKPIVLSGIHEDM